MQEKTSKTIKKNLQNSKILRIPFSFSENSKYVIVCEWQTIPLRTQSIIAISFYPESSVPMLCPGRRWPTFCRASSSSRRLFSSCLAAAAPPAPPPPPPPICSSSSRLVDTLAFSYSSCRWACSSRAFFRALSASCCGGGGANLMDLI